jgi:hypothetical protein
LLRLSRENIVRLRRTEAALVRSLKRDPLLTERVKRLMSIPGVGPITALTWVLELGDVKRFPSIKQVISYCGLCRAEDSSAGTAKRTPISKQRNRHLQTVLVEAAHLAPRLNPDLALLYGKEPQKGSRNRAIRLGDGAEAPGAPSHLFRDWQRTQTQSSAEAAAQPPLEAANGWMVLRIAGTLPTGIQRNERLSRLSFFALLRARWESLFLVDKTYHGWTGNSHAADLRNSFNAHMATYSRAKELAQDG